MYAKKEGTNVDIDIHITTSAKVKSQINEIVNKLYDLDDLIGADGQI